jgi:ribosomal protein S18 acetylase RimI-like enzyme
MMSQRVKFSGTADIEAMSALVHAFPADHLHVVDLPYRLSSWAFDDSENVGLWVGPGCQLHAWAVMQPPFWTIDYAFHPDADRDLRRKLWAWADRRARELLATPSGRPAWFVNVFADQPDRIDNLEEAGFASQADVGEDSWSRVFMARSAGLPAAKHEVSAGFKIRSLAGEAEVGAYVELHRAVFESKNMTVEWRVRTLRRPEYVPDLDLVAVAPDGRLAAFCVCWLGRHSEAAISGQIEPLGVRAEFSRLGLGRAILSEGLRRLVGHGAGRIYVETDSWRNAALATYESVGVRVIRNVLVYRKDYQP